MVSDSGQACPWMIDLASRNVSFIVGCNSGHVIPLYPAVYKYPSE